MFVRDRMSRHPITITPQTNLHDALQIMREEHVRRLPVLDKTGRLVGIVGEKDLLYASPSPATSLSVYELNYLVAKITVEDLMSRDVVAVEEDCPLEEAARIMADHDIGGLPVMRGNTLVGMITESDLFRIFLELLGARVWGLRVTIRVPEQQGFLARLTGRLAAHGDDPTNREIVFKVQNLERDDLEGILRDLEVQVVDIREKT